MVADPGIEPGCPGYEPRVVTRPSAAPARGFEPLSCSFGDCRHRPEDSNPYLAVLETVVLAIRPDRYVPSYVHSTQHEPLPERRRPS